MTTNKTIQNAFKDFDLTTLDLYERQQYATLTATGRRSKQDALQLLINNVEGDYSELSPSLAALASEIDTL